jgi:hypothetical protein
MADGRPKAIPATIVTNVALTMVRVRSLVIHGGRHGGTQSSTVTVV